MYSKFTRIIVKKKITNRACIFLDKLFTSIAIPGRGSGRPRKSWKECVKADVDVYNLEGIDPEQNREARRSGVRRTSQLQLNPGTGKLSAVFQ